LLQVDQWGCSRFANQKKKKRKIAVTSAVGFAPDVLARPSVVAPQSGCQAKQADP
jgi:hypothetical protein